MSSFVNIEWVAAVVDVLCVSVLLRLSSERDKYTYNKMVLGSAMIRTPVAFQVKKNRGKINYLYEGFIY